MKANGVTGEVVGKSACHDPLSGVAGVRGSGRIWSGSRTAPESVTRRKDRPAITAGQSAMTP